MNRQAYPPGGIRLIAACLFIFSLSQQSYGRNYYLGVSGNDRGKGTREDPWKSIPRLNRAVLKAGDTVFFQSGGIFPGSIQLGPQTGGTAVMPVVITSDGSRHAVIHAGSGTGILLDKCQYVTLCNLDFLGAGRKKGNTHEGVTIRQCGNIHAEHLDITGFQKAGLMIYASTDITVSHISAHENGSAGIAVEGDFSSKKTSRNIRILDCRTEDNPGDPTNLTNHSGNGIVAGHCTGLLVDRCTATNNGWDMPRIGNGPVGIWCYEADSVLIQHCLAYRNKTSPGAADGGGFDLDGGVTNSIIQYCFSYGNQGSGYCIFQYWGASPWHHNIIRYNISEDDGTVSDSQAGLYIWNSSDDEKQFYDCEVYGNIVYNTKVAAISFSDKSENKEFRFSNNIFVGKDSLIRGEDKIGQCIFQYNDWWSMDSRFNIGGFRDLKAWAMKTGKEQEEGKVVGQNIDPHFKNPGKAALTSASQLRSFTGYDLPANAPLRATPVFTGPHGIHQLKRAFTD